MKTSELRELAPDALRARLAEERTELETLRFQNAITRLENPGILREKRKTIARILTLLNEQPA
ncbi:MAG: 50S ribosomal protein L29 [Rhodothermales bacterium]|nr:50S ribosomal protein L29 [Rhodothermales bacterium]MCA0269360.1 50S ribosomal protein L29 [Bacteroidota bacterium]